MCTLKSGPGPGKAWHGESIKEAHIEVARRVVIEAVVKAEAALMISDALKTTREKLGAVRRSQIPTDSN